MQLVFMRPSKTPGVSYEKKITAIGWIAALATVAFLGSTLASNISLNSNESIEFGQGVAQTTSCDSSVIVTPTSTFDTSVNAFVLDQIAMSDIAASCIGARFILNFYSTGDSTPLNNEQVIVDFASDSVNGNNYTDGYWDDGAVINVSNGDMVSANIDLTNNGLDGNLGKSDVTINGVTSNGVDAISANDVDRITIESHDSSYLREALEVSGRATLYGGTGGGEFSTSCDPGQIIKSVTFAQTPHPSYGFYGYMHVDCVLVGDVNGTRNDIEVVDSQTKLLGYDNFMYTTGHSSSECQAGAAGVGLNVVEGDYISGVGIRCATYSSGANQSNKTVVGSTATAAHSWCPAGSWMTGVYGRKGAGIDSLGAICTPLANL